MIEKGKHRGRALRAELGVTSNNNEQIGIEFEFLDLPGVRRTYYGTFTPNGMEHTIKAMRAAGHRGDDVTDMSWFEREDAPEVILVVDHETYNGQTRDKIKFVNSAGGVAMKNALTPEAKRAFAARMRGELVAHDMSEGGNAPPPSSPQRSAPIRQPQRSAPPNSNDDIPF